MSAPNLWQIDQLIFSALHKSAPETLEGCLHRPMPPDASPATLPCSAWLKALLEAKGPQALLELPSYAPTSPLLLFLINSATPAACIGKLSRYGADFLHGMNIELREEGDRYLLVEQMSAAPGHPAEVLFACGLVSFVLNQMGCRDLRVEWEAASSWALKKQLRNLGVVPGSRGESVRWRFRWRRFSRPLEIPGLDEFCLASISTQERKPERPVTGSVAAQVELSLGTRLTIEEAASRLRMAPRTLQRKLAAEGTSFSKVVMQTRLQMAEQLLHRPKLSLTEIGYLAGFSDGPHFSREFKKAWGVTPRDFRRAALARGAGYPEVHRAAPRVSTLGLG